MLLMRNTKVNLHRDYHIRDTRDLSRYGNPLTYRLACLLADKIRRRQGVDCIYVVDTKSGRAMSEVIR